MDVLMGYDVTQQTTVFSIPQNRQQEALAAVRALFQPDAIDLLARGSTANWWGFTYHYSWVDTAAALSCATLPAMLAEWGWGCSLNDAGDILGIDFESERLGQEDILFAALAPFVTAGSFIQMLSEDGEQWRWVFDGEAMREVRAVVTFPE